MSGEVTRAKVLSRADWVAIAWSAAFFIWLLFFGRGDAALRDAADTVFFLVPGAAVAWITWRTSRLWPHDSATRRAWALIALAHLLYWAGGQFWTVLIFVAPSLSVTRWADSLSLPSYLPTLWGVLLFPGIRRRGSSPIPFVLDSALIFLGAGLGAWYFIYRPAFYSPDASATALYIAFVYPAIDLSVLVMTGASYLRASHPATRLALGWLFASKAASMIGDTWYGLLRLGSGYYPGHWVDAFWFASWMLAWVGARVVQVQVARGAAAVERERGRDYRGALMPYLFALSAQALLFWVLRGRLATPVGTVALAASLITVLIIFRQLAELRENDRLYQRERGQEARFRSLVQQGTDVLLVVGEGEAILYRSPSAERLFEGMTEPATVGAIFGSESAVVSALVAGLSPGRVAGPQPVRFQRPDGDGVLHLEFVATDLRQDPAVGGVVLTGRDVSERKALQDELLHAQKMRAIAQMAGGLAHDLNNHLTTVRGCVDLLAGELPESDPARADATEIAHATDRAVAITRQLLQLSRREVVRPVLLDFNAVLAGLEPILRRLLPEGIELRVERSAEPLRTMADRSRLEQVILNLTVNARDAMASGGTLSLRTFSRRVSLAEAMAEDLPPGDQVVLEVHDTGAGMDAATLARVFEPFFTTKEQGKGTGLGLATVQASVADAGGRVLVTSAPAQGSTFTVLLPRSHATAEATPAPPASVAAWGAGARVLVVEDEETVLRVTSRMLERKGYRVVQAREGAEALSMLAGGEVDLVLTDLMMRGMGGAELIARLAERAPRLPVICMSGHAADEASRLQATSGATAFLAKPFTADELHQAIAEALARRVKAQA